MGQRQILVGIFCLLLISCTSNSKRTKITVAAAASTQYVLAELIDVYTQKHTVDVHKIISSSGKITAQITNGAPIDIFISADQYYPNHLHQQHLTTATPITYAHGSLVLWTFNQLPLHQGLTSLNNESIHKIALADPKTAPYGKQSVSILKQAQLYTQLEEKIVWGESISQVNQYINTQSVDIGLTAKSVVMAPHLKGKGTYIDIPNSALAQSMILIQQPNRQIKAAANDFYTFLQSDIAREIFKKYGYH